MIDETTFASILKREFPGYWPFWIEESVLLDKDGPKRCSEMSALVQYVVSLLQDGDFETTRRVFVLVEEMLYEGRPRLQTLTTTCFLEGLKKVMADEQILWSHVEPFLGPIAAAWSQYIDEFRNGWPE